MGKAAWAFAATAVLLGTTRPARASDLWEIAGDDTALQTTNILRPGIVQAGHDLDGTAGAPDQDWMRLVLKGRHSYEARVSGGFWRHDPGALRPTFDLVAADGTVIINGAASPDEIVADSERSVGRSLRFFMNFSDSALFLRASAPAGVATDNTTYSVALYDTTLFVPRWNNSGTQTTVLVLQNTTFNGVTGTVHFHDAAGALITSAGFAVPARGVHVMSTASIFALAGRSGSALIVQGSFHGALVGKAVALEAATGFTFDTPVVPVPR